MHIIFHFSTIHCHNSKGPVFVLKLSFNFFYLLINHLKLLISTLMQFFIWLSILNNKTIQIIINVPLGGLQCSFI